ncbi:MAG: hypothetical protein KOO62_08255 [candidate division Zixibacteria bacterium]|nr:hypothetical protein [candidate division Zixibacteria bacterium]
MNDIKGSFIAIKDTVTADMICSSKHQNEHDPARLAEHLFENLDNGVPEKIAPASILIVGDSFGRGMVGDVPVRALLAAGIKCVIGVNFERGFYRTGINGGLALVEADLLAGQLSNGDSIAVNLAEGTITYAGGETTFAPYPKSVRQIIETGGLVPAVKTQLGKT